jgi:hypothetical protein
MLRLDYRDAVRLSARGEILTELAEDAVTARLHADTARFHHGSAHAYGRGRTNRDRYVCVRRLTLSLSRLLGVRRSTVSVEGRS